MPLPPSVARKPIHARSIACRGYLREDGLWDIEGQITDTKSYDFHNEWRGAVTRGTPVHDMWIRLTVDETFVVRDVEAVTDASPYAICPDITPNFKQLIGLRIARGWTRRARERVGGTHGCTHLVELLAPIATTAFQAIGGYQRKRARESEESPGASRGVRPSILNTCHAWASDSEIVRRWAPQFYTGAETEPGRDPAPETAERG
jgi:hypothetical protein